MVLRASYVGEFGYHGLLSVDPNAIPTANLFRSGRLFLGWHRLGRKGLVPQGAQYIPGPHAKLPNPELGAGFFWYTEGNSSYNALQVDVSHRFSHGLQFRANYTWSKDLDMNSALTGAQAWQSVADGYGSLRSASRLGTVGVQHPEFSQPFGHLPVAVWQRQAVGRLAVQHHCHAGKRFSFHSGDWLESIRGRRYQKPRSAFAESCFFRTGGVRQSE
jgi:hypothetical protein